jgi:hypothetical protein
MGTMGRTIMNKVVIFGRSAVTYLNPRNDKDGQRLELPDTEESRSVSLLLIAFISVI